MDERGLQRLIGEVEYYAAEISTEFGCFDIGGAIIALNRVKIRLSLLEGYLGDIAREERDEG